MKNTVYKLTHAALAVVTILIMSANFAQAQETAGQGGNGGAGINRGGRLMTFYSAGFYTEPNEATSDEVPQLPQLIQFMNQTQYMSELTKVKYVSALVPSSARNYYKVQPSTFTPEVRARLVAKYGEIMKINTNEIAIFAITDQTSKTTYLFPEFYSLTPIEQQAILFHEAYWIVNPTATYLQVVQAEMSFQAYLAYPSSSDRLLRWLKCAGTFGDVLVAAIRSDLRSGAMKGLVRDQKISFPNLFGQQFLDCKSRRIGSECTAFLVTYAYQLTLRYPNSLFIKLYYDRLVQSKFRLEDNFDNNMLSVISAIQSANDVSLELSSASYSGSAAFTTNYVQTANVPEYYIVTLEP